MRPALLSHWPEYVMEAAGLALFMISAGLFGTLLGDPESAVHQAADSHSPTLGCSPGALKEPEMSRHRLVICAEPLWSTVN